MRPPITSTLNDKVLGKSIRWCTPSIILHQERLKDIYESDISVSVEKLGNYYLGGMLCDKGIFKKSMDLAAKTYGSDKTIYGVNGTTGSNFITMWYLRDHFKEKHERTNILSTKNIHKSVIYSLEAFSTNIEFMGFKYDPKFDLFIPPKPDEILTILKENDKINTLWITNPTYGGLSMHLEETINIVREINENIVIVVDEAWGSHFGFHPDLPESAVRLGADIIVQSTHKQGGSLQQSAMIHLNKKVIDINRYKKAVKHYTTTSPSYILMSSLDSVVSLMASEGKKIMQKILDKSEYFRESLEEKLHPKIEILSTDYIKKNWSDNVSSIDTTKTILDLSRVDISGNDLSEKLQRMNSIVPEKSHPTTITFITTHQLNKKDINKTVNAMGNLTSKLKEISKPTYYTIPNLKRSKSDYADIFKMTKKDLEVIKLENSIGRISAENIIPYPPGIPVVVKGDVLDNNIIIYLKEISKNGVELINENGKSSKIKVLKNNRKY